MQKDDVQTRVEMEKEANAGPVKKLINSFLTFIMIQFIL